MNKKQFIEELEKRLKYIPSEDRIDALSYYSEYLEDMNVSDSDDVTAIIGLPKNAASQILSECTKKHLSTNKKTRSTKQDATIVWLIILAVFSIPVLIPFALVIFALLLAFFAVAFALIIAGIAVMIFSFTAGSIPQIIVCFGTGLIIIALGILLLLGLIALTRLIIVLTANIIGKLSKEEIKKDEQMVE